MLVQVGANGLQRRVIWHRIWIFGIGNDDHCDHAGHLARREVRMVQRQRLCPSNVCAGSLRCQVFIISGGDRAVLALQSRLCPFFGCSHGFLVRSSGRRSVIDRAVDAGKRGLNLGDRVCADISIAASAGPIPAGDDVRRRVRGIDQCDLAVLAVAQRDHAGIAINREHAVRRFRTEEIVHLLPNLESLPFVDFEPDTVDVHFRAVGVYCRNENRDAARGC